MKKVKCETKREFFRSVAEGIYLLIRILRRAGASARELASLAVVVGHLSQGWQNENERRVSDWNMVKMKRKQKLDT